MNTERASRLVNRKLQAIAQQESHQDKIQENEEAMCRAEIVDEINRRQNQGERVRAEMEAILVDEIVREEEQQCIQVEDSMAVQMSYVDAVGSHDSEVQGEQA